MDGKKEDLEEHFKGIYENLYNSVDDKDNLENLLDDVNKVLITLMYIVFRKSLQMLSKRLKSI